jgi:hypothetical protein
MNSKCTWGSFDVLVCAGNMAPYDPYETDGYMDEMLPADCLSIQEIGTAGT